jgi:protein TonB
MTLKKTISVSIVLHICFFSAALLLSARMFGGSGKLPETDVVFIRLAAHEPAAVEAAAVPEKIPAVKKAEKPPVALKVEPEPVLADIAIEKAEEISEDVVPEEVVLATSETMKEESAAEPVPLQEEEDHVEEAGVAQVFQDPIASGSEEFVSDRHGHGLLPGTIELISMAIERVKTYPIIARKRGIEGTVHVSFNIMADGNPYGIKILKSSGFRILDKATVKVVKKAAPFPLVASRIVLPVAYRLRN